MISVKSVSERLAATDFTQALKVGTMTEELPEIDEPVNAHVAPHEDDSDEEQKQEEDAAFANGSPKSAAEWEEEEVKRAEKEVPVSGEGEPWEENKEENKAEIPKETDQDEQDEEIEELGEDEPDDEGNAEDQGHTEAGEELAVEETQEQDKKQPEESDRHKRFVYFTAVSSGLGDRLRGLVVAYYLSLLTDRQLLVKNPVDDNSLIAIPKDFTPPFETVPKHLSRYQHHCNNCGEKIKTEDFTRLANTDVIQFTSNRGDLTHLFDNPTLAGSPGFPDVMAIKDKGLLWSTALGNTLLIGDRVKELLEQVHHDHFQGKFFKVAIHIRVSDRFMIRPKRDRTNTFSVPCFAHQAMKVWDAMTPEDQAMFPDGLKVFVTADTPAYAEGVQKLLTAKNVTWFDTTPYAGRPVHIRAKTDQTRTMLDWWLFTQMDFIVAARSGFSETAAKYACKGYAVHCPSSPKFDGQEDWCERFFVYGAPGLCQPLGFDTKPFLCP